MRKLLIIALLIAAIGVQAQDTFTFSVKEKATVGDPSEITYVDTDDEIIWTAYKKDIPKSTFGVAGAEYQVRKLITAGTDTEGYPFSAYRVKNDKGQLLTIKVRVVGDDYDYPIQVYLIEDDGTYTVMNCTKKS